MKISDNKIRKIPKFIVMEFPRKRSVFGQFSVKFPRPNPLQNANFINIVVSASLTLSEIGRNPNFGQIAFLAFGLFGSY